MILQKIFHNLKSPGIADSWLVHTRLMQYFLKTGLKSYNFLVMRTGLFQQAITGSQGTGNTLDPTAIIDYNHVIIGDFTTIEKNVVIEKNSTIGNHVLIEDGAAIGSEGFEFRRVAGEVLPVHHTGGVIIHDNVRIGQRVCIDKSMQFPPTEIGDSSVILAYSHIGHGVKIGQDTLLAEGTMVGGHASIGNRVRIGKDCSLADAIIIGDDVVVPDRTVVTRNMQKMIHEPGNLS